MAQPHVTPGYVAAPMERFGRRIKLEYVGMVSVYAIIALLIFRGLDGWFRPLLAAIGALFLFLGLKKKTRDHLSGSLVLMAAALLARPAVVSLDWVVPFLLFAGCVCAMEGWVEKRQEQIWALPLLFFIWGWLDASWIPALGFVATYLSHPWSERPGLRRRLGWVLLPTALAPLVGVWWTARGTPGPALELHPPTSTLLAVWVALAVAVAVILVLYWRRLIAPHRLAPILLAVLAPWDLRLLAMFGMTAAVLLTATVFRLSIDSELLRPTFKHAEWHYFWYVFALAIWAVVTY